MEGVIVDNYQEDHQTNYELICHFEAIFENSPSHYQLSTLYLILFLFW